MTIEEFDLVKKYETEKGNLKDGKFVLMISELGNRSFTIQNTETSIVLSYHDEQSTSYETDSYGNPTFHSGFSYSFIENKLVDILNEKYEKVSSQTYSKQPLTKPKDGKISLEYIEQTSFNYYPLVHKTLSQYKTVSNGEEKLITLKSEFTFYDKNYNKFTSKPGATAFYKPDRGSMNVKIGECKITLTYEFLNDYLSREKEQKIREKEQVKMNEQERAEHLNQIQNNNNKL
jgi:hypothetical protein